MKSFAVLGLGRFGKEMALQLARGGAEVLAVDMEQKNVDEVADVVTRAVRANIQERDSLEELGIAECDEVIVAVGSDLATSVLAVMNLKTIGVKHMTCKAYDEVCKEVLLKLGADRVLIPEQEFAAKLAAQMINPRMLDSIQLTDGYLVNEFAAPKSWIGKPLKELRLPDRYGVTVILIRHPGKTVTAPQAADRIQEEDILLLLGKQSAFEEVRNIH